MYLVTLVSANIKFGNDCLCESVGSFWIRLYKFFEVFMDTMDECFEPWERKMLRFGYACTFVGTLCDVQPEQLRSLSKMGGIIQANLGLVLELRHDSVNAVLQFWHILHAVFS